MRIGTWKSSIQSPRRMGKISNQYNFRIYEYVPLSRFKEVASDSVAVGGAVATDLEDVFED